MFVSKNDDPAALLMIENQLNTNTALDQTFPVPKQGTSSPCIPKGMQVSFQLVLAWQGWFSMQGCPWKLSQNFLSKD